MNIVITSNNPQDAVVIRPDGTIQVLHSYEDYPAPYMLVHALVVHDKIMAELKKDQAYTEQHASYLKQV